MTQLAVVLAVAAVAFGFILKLISGLGAHRAPGCPPSKADDRWA
jgi:hypothetical protein